MEVQKLLNNYNSVDIPNADLDIVTEYYGCNYIRAAEILTIINNRQFSLIKNKLQKGGTHE